MESTDQKSRSGRIRPLILIAEDAGVQVRLTQICLERAGYDTLAVSDGAQAIEKSTSELPDLLILDVELPEVNGFQVLDRLRKNEATRHIPIIMLTAHAKDAPLFAEWAGKADLFMTKPFSPKELLTEVARILSLTSTGK